VRVIIVWYLSNIAWNIYQLGHSDFTKFADFKAVGASLLLPGPLANPATPLWVYILCVLLVSFLFLWSFERLNILAAVVPYVQTKFSQGHIGKQAIFELVGIIILIVIPALWGALGWTIIENPNYSGLANLPHWYPIILGIIYISGIPFTWWSFAENLEPGNFKERAFLVGFSLFFTSIFLLIAGLFLFWIFNAIAWFIHLFIH